MIEESSLKKVLILGGSRLQVPAIEAAQRLGFSVLCADRDPDAVGFGVADACSLTSTLDAAAIERLALEEGASYVITSTSDAPVRVAALVSENLGLPTGISYANAVCATQKDSMRLRFAECGIPMPDFRICSTVEEFESALGHFGYDCIAKPADSAASRGVRLINAADRRARADLLFKEFASFSRKGVVMVEERVRGFEVSVESMTLGGATTVVSVTDKLTTEPPYFVELGHSEPSRLPVEAQKRICQVAKKVVEAIGIVDGPAHTEIMLTEDGPKVIEMAARLGGDFISSRLVPLSTGITADRKGVIKKIAIPEGIEDAEGVEEVRLYLSAGDSIDAPHSSGDRIGHVVCSGEDALQAAFRAEWVMSNIEVDLG